MNYKIQPNTFGREYDDLEKTQRRLVDLLNVNSIKNDSIEEAIKLIKDRISIEIDRKNYFFPSIAYALNNNYKISINVIDDGKCIKRHYISFCDLISLEDLNKILIFVTERINYNKEQKSKFENEIYYLTNLKKGE